VPDDLAGELVAEHDVRVRGHLPKVNVGPVS
jgi:hypothetical protein